MMLGYAKPAWYTTRRFSYGSLVIFALFLAIEAYLAIFVRNNDFLVHREYGRIFLRGDPAAALQLHYLLGRGMVNALTAWLPYRLDRALHFATAVVALIVCLRWWHQLANRGGTVDANLAWAAGVFTLVLASGYVIRDLDDCGLQIWLLFFLTAAARALSVGRPGLGGFWLGLAATYKVTPLLFLPFLLWKRQGRAAGWMAVSFVLLNLAPALYLGWDKTVDSHRQWLAFAQGSLAAPDPSYNGLETPRHLNQGLPLALARFLQTYPPGHPLALDHPWFYQPGNLSPQRAKLVSTASLLALAAVLAWRWRRPLVVEPPNARLAHEWAAVTLLCALLSPLCWLQHLVLLVPSVFLWVRAWLAGAALPRWQRGGMLLFALIVLTVHREFMTARLYTLLVAYKLHTLAGLLALGLVLTLPEKYGSERKAETPLQPSLAA